MRTTEVQDRFRQLQLEREKLFKDYRTSLCPTQVLVKLMDIDEEIEEIKARIKCMPNDQTKPKKS